MFRFEDILIGSNVSLTNYKRFLEKRGPRPFGFYTEWIDKSIYIVDVALPPHEYTIGEFIEGILFSLRNNYKRKLFILTGAPALKFSNRCVQPDLSFGINKKFIDSRFIHRTNAIIPTIVGEIAYSERLEHLLDKCEDYITDLSADIAIAVHVPKPKIVDESLVVPTGVDLYIMYRNDINRVPIQVPFDREFTFQLRTKSLERKIRKELIPNFEHQFDSIDVTIMLEKDVIFVPETLESVTPEPETLESHFTI